MQDREIYVSLDGAELAILRYGDVVTHDIPAGPHQLRAHNTLFRKFVDLDLAADEDARFIAINKPGFGTYTLMSILGAGPLYLTFERVS